MPRDQPHHSRGHPYHHSDTQSSHQPQPSGALRPSPRKGQTSSSGHKYQHPAEHRQQPGSSEPSPHQIRQQGRRARPLYNQALVSQAEVSDRRDESLYRDRVCELCSDEGHKVCHHHVSSQSVRLFATKYQSGYLFHCMMCKAQESTVRPHTRKLILTTSTLYNVWTCPDLNLPIHIDIESIVGGRIRDLTRALHMLYLIHPERLEIIVIGGLNNIGDSQTAEEIMEELTELRLTVKVHSEMHQHDQPSILSVSTLLYAPKFCSLDLPNNCPAEWIPPVGFQNRRNLIEEVNEGIKSMNLEAKVNYLKLHMEGVRIDKGTGKTLHKHNPVKPVWRESEVRRRLHLTPEYKAKVAQRAAKLFTGGLDNIGNWPK